MVKKMIPLHLDSFGIIQPILINEFLLGFKKLWFKFEKVNWRNRFVRDL